MLDIKRIKEDPEKVKAGLRAKEVDCDQEVDRILELDKVRRDTIFATEQMKAEQNKVSKTIPQLKKAGEDTAPVFQRMGELKAQIAANDEKLRSIEGEYHTLMLSLPNLPDDDLKPGGKENNEPLRYFGEPHKFDFEPKHHVDLCTDLGLIDYPRGVKLAGSGFWMYTGMGARLEWALLNYFIDCHLADGYEFILPPHMLEYQFTRPEDSDDAFDELVAKAENLVKGLGFHFRTVKLAAGDCSASMARTYDIEIQIPSMQGYKEVSSVSNARDYQARRGNTRFRREATGKPEFVHTLNGSGLATSRIFPAMVEQNQLKDGSIKVPEVLQKYLGGLEVISKK